MRSLSTHERLAESNTVRAVLPEVFGVIRDREPGPSAAFQIA